MMMMQHLCFAVARGGGGGISQRPFRDNAAFHLSAVWNRRQPLHRSRMPQFHTPQQHRRFYFCAFLSASSEQNQRKRQGRQPPSSSTISTLGLSSMSGDSDQSSSSPSRNNTSPKKKVFNNKKKKWKINPNAGQANADALAREFAKLAAKEGFDSSTSYFAHSSKLEKDYVDNDDDDNIDEDVWLDNDNEDDIENDDGDEGDNNDIEADLDDEASDKGLRFDERTRRYIDTYDDEDLFMDMDDDPDDMDARIAAARRDRDSGRVSVPKALDKLADEISPKVMKELGFRRETNPFGNDETPRKDAFMLITNAMTCSACGSDFQSTDERKPGYLPPEKYDIQKKLLKIEELQKLQEKAESAEWSVEDEVEWLIQKNDGSPNATVADCQSVADLDIDAVAEDMGLDLLELSKKKVICRRCHGLQNFGKVDNFLRPGWTNEPMLSQENFREMLKPIRLKTAVIIALVDLFDFSGSVLPELDAIAGDNPVILAANKADLLPGQMGHVRAENWVRRELEYIGVKSIANIGGAIRLVSCKTGFGVSALLDKAKQLAHQRDCDIYVVGAANAGKSTLINHILQSNVRRLYPWQKEKLRAGNLNSFRGAITTSPLPGTTLKFIKADLGGGMSLYDTPGLLVPGSLTQLLTPEELKIAMPKNQVEPITFRIESGKCVLIGALAKVELVGDCKPFLFTFFVANGIKLHPTDSARSEKVVAEHVGELLVPPLPPGPERLEQIGEFTSHEIEVEGTGWKQAAADISLRGLGWIAVTGAGTARIKITVPKDLGISVRPPLMPFDIWEVAAKYTGSRAFRKSSQSKSGKRRKGVGRN